MLLYSAVLIEYVSRILFRKFSSLVVGLFQASFRDHFVHDDSRHRLLSNSPHLLGVLGAGIETGSSKMFEGKLKTWKFQTY